MLLGNAAVQHPQAAQLRAWAQWIAKATRRDAGRADRGREHGRAHMLVGAKPAAGGLDARAMLEQPRKAYLLWNVEPEYDTADPVATIGALRQAETVIAFSPYRNGALEYADAILPIAPFTETRGHLRQLPRAACRASTAPCDRWARRVPAGRCCACSAICSSSHGFD